MTATAAVALMAPAAVPVSVYAATFNTGGSAACGVEGQIDNAPTTGCTVQTTGTSFNGLVAKIINIFSVIVGVIAVVMIIIGGLRYITSGGDSGNVSSAKNTIIYALVGLVIVALAQFIVRFVLSNTTSAVGP